MLLLSIPLLYVYKSSGSKRLFEILLFYNLSFVSKMHDFLIQNLYLKNLFSGYKIDILYSLS